MLIFFKCENSSTFSGTQAYSRAQKFAESVKYHHTKSYKMHVIFFI